MFSAWTENYVKIGEENSMFSGHTIISVRYQNQNTFCCTKLYPHLVELHKLLKPQLIRLADCSVYIYVFYFLVT